MKKITVAIAGYGNLGRGVELAVKTNEDMELYGIFTRRPPASIQPVYADTKVYSLDTALAGLNGIDVMILCGGSATDLEKQSPQLATWYNVVDSFDTHARIPEHFAKVDAAAKKSRHTALISSGWDPGLFSLNRLIAEAVLPRGKSETFWGKGVSQGHSDALRRIPGVADAVQYTIPLESALHSVRSGSGQKLSAREKHLRECFVVLAPGADQQAIHQTIVTMPNYFADYNTEVHFISQAELEKNHAGMPHGGFVLRQGATGAKGEHGHLYELSLKLDSNPEFTASIVVAYARAVSRLAAAGDFGGKTVFDIAPGLLSPRSPESLRAELL